MMALSHSPRIQNLRGISVTAWNLEREVEIWDNPASVARRQSVWLQLPLGVGRLGRVDRIEAGGVAYLPSYAPRCILKFSAKKAITKACHMGNKLQTWVCGLYPSPVLLSSAHENPPLYRLFPGIDRAPRPQRARTRSKIIYLIPHLTIMSTIILTIIDIAKAPENFRIAETLLFLFFSIAF